ncbi:MAG: biopolymer transporter ExbD [Spirochaetes bacterium]|nr:biopolymer transporter ExbD [Spirochaetota bacterium]MBN2769970.1 biopolymer transporter ExbD [Spirochaetota bacterium]
MIVSRKNKKKSVLPVSAMSDIAFLLLIFFMLSSISEEDKEIQIELPSSRVSVQEDKKFFNVWVDSAGDIFFNAKKGSPAALTTYALYKLKADPETRVLIRASRDVSYSVIDSVFESLREAGAYNVVLVSEKRYYKEPNI